MTTDRFYSNIPSFNHFKDAANSQHYHSVPKDWMVIVTDVQGSTQAIEKGKYRDVNTIGAATITAVQNILGEKTFPFVFGGDGATLLISPADYLAVKNELLGLKNLALKKFNLTLRVGSISVHELMQLGGTIEVAKFKLAGTQAIALLRGNGISLAENKIKTPHSKYEALQSHEQISELKGLSCRWQNIPSKNGKIISLLVSANNQNSEFIYKLILDKLDSLFKGQWNSANPVHTEQMQYKSFWQCFREEVRYHDSLFSKAFIRRFVSILVSFWSFKLKKSPGFFNPQEYANSLPSHSDYRKFDGVLRLVLDCQQEHIDEIVVFLNQLHLKGELFYGIHESDTAQMTCYAPSLNEGGHIHFIDGGDGGYTMAAKKLKSQMRTQAKTNPTEVPIQD